RSFGSNLEALFADGEDELIEQFVFNEIYDDTKINASRVNEKNNFIMDISFEGGTGRGGSAGANGRRVNNTIQLPFNVDANSITVSVGGRILRSGQDYTISGIGTLTIDDQIASSCLEVRIQFEEEDLFNFQTKWFSGLRAEYVVNDNFNMGATLLRLNERPGGISRFSIGDEPLRNTKWGLDVNYSAESRLLTKMVDFLPLLNTKEPSNISFNAEFAQLLPGTSNIVDGEGTSYLDDFENAITPIVLGNFQGWKLGATPVTHDNRFFDSSEASTLRFNDRKAKIAWYTVDNTVFYNNNPRAFPDNLTSDEIRQNLYERPFIPQELFPGRDRDVVQTNEPLLDIAYFPRERGQNNYTTELTQDGLLPEASATRNFGAITRANTVLTNFVQQNIEYIEFWLLDPFGDVVKDGLFNQRNTDSNGELIINLGDVSEDVLKDDRFAFEHGLPENGDLENTTQNLWGKVTDDTYLTDVFPNNTTATRDNQDVGLDGLNNEEEANFDSFQGFVGVANVLNPDARDRVLADVSADDFQHFLAEELDPLGAGIVQRYKNYNGLDGNNGIFPNALVPTAFSNNPDKEDLNLDNTLQSIENYFEYRIPINRDELRVGQGFVVDQIDVPTENETASWYLFRIPISKPNRTVGNPDLQTIKYTRMYLTGWTQPVVLRMAKFQMVGSKWLRVTEPLNAPGFSEIPDPSVTDFNVTVVSVEENAQAVGNKSPYVLPPGLSRDQDNTTTNVRRQNEQSVQICIDDLQDQDSRAIFKQVNFDLVNYGTIRMFLHAEPYIDDNLQDGDLSGFLRMGNSENQNYYEIEVDLEVTRGPFSADNDQVRRQVWPEANEINLALDELYALKSERNRLGLNPLNPFSRRSTDGKYRLTVVGDPKLSIVRTLVIGVRNPSRENDGGAPRSVCLWANELRVTDFDQTKGWAGRARLNTKLADFATVSASASYQGIGFGGIQDNIIQRSRKETTNYSVSANVNADKLLPGNHGIK
ncbi:MAG: cell surface protein SprA, partial [Bacteroidota bacterium]